MQEPKEDKDEEYCKKVIFGLEEISVLGCTKMWMYCFKNLLNM
jgi:hypothetical protein